MGIDIYAHWDGQSEDEMRAQFAVWLTATAGGRGYLREAYHGEPYATHHLCAEAFETGEARIPAAVLRDRLSRALQLAEERQRKLYGGEDAEAVKQSFRDFVALCDEKERETGASVRIIASF